MTYMFGGVLLMVPLYQIAVKSGLAETATGSIIVLIIIYVVQTLPVSMYMLGNYFRSIPESLEEAPLDTDTEPLELTESPVNTFTAPLAPTLPPSAEATTTPPLTVASLDPLSSDAGRDQALAHAEDLGLDACRDCKGCKCGVGIDLMGKVVRPLLEAAGE